ncbi:hypothetical protein ACFVH6_22310 [Spirillospora sp. NPDC127200]
MSGDPIDFDWPPLYAAVLAAYDRLVVQGGSATYEEIGTEAWRRITPEQQLGALPYALGVYAQRVVAEQNERHLHEKAADPAHSYLGDHDVACLWDSLVLDADEDGEVPADRDALGAVLAELQLLQHRLAMRTPDN